MSWRENGGDYWNPSSQDYINPERREYLESLERKKKQEKANPAPPVEAEETKP